MRKAFGRFFKSATDAEENSQVTFLTGDTLSMRTSVPFRKITSQHFPLLRASIGFKVNS